MTAEERLINLQGDFWGNSTVRLSLLAMAALGLVIVSTDAESATVTATDDRTIGDTDGDGIGDFLLDQTDGFLRTGFSTAFWRSAIEFDLSGIPAGQMIDSAWFSIRDQGSSRDGTLNVFGYEGDGVITTADASETANMLGSFDVVAASGRQDFQLDVTSFLQSIYDNDADYLGIMITAATASGLGGGASDMCSVEPFAVCDGVVPTLRVEFSPVAPVPLPASLPMLLATLGGLGWMARRWKAA